MKNIYIIFFVLITLFTNNQVLALNFDTSIDAEIKQKYNSTKLENEVLPNLPKVPASSKPAYKNNTTIPKETSQETKPTITKVDPKDAIKINKRTKFQANSNQKISDWLSEGTLVSFTTTLPVYKKYVTIPSGTKITAMITDSHQPQITGNGGLVELKITAMNYNGKNYTLNGKITKANHKKIFFNNIKGKRKYLKGIANQVNNGEKFYKKSRNISGKLANNPIGVIFSPIPTVIGIAGYSICTILSPITAIGTKGENITIPAGSQFEIKLLDNAFIY
ncbi:MAG: hypothetical protein E7Z87_00620 [Cyanobacteria bacterium SIG26]|nr:hypothetical protein [Cyanobacteria bacterium SIG26]